TRLPPRQEGQVDGREVDRIAALGAPCRPAGERPRRREALSKPALGGRLDDHPFERAPPPEPDQHPLRRRLLKRPRELVAKALAAEHVEVRQAELHRAARERLDAGAEPLEESRRPEDP